MGYRNCLQIIAIMYCSGTETRIWYNARTEPVPFSRCVCTAIKQLSSFHFQFACLAHWVLLFQSLLFLCSSVYFFSGAIFVIPLFPLCSFLFALCSFLFALSSLLFALSSLLFPLCSLLFALCSLLFPLCSFLFALCSLLFPLVLSAFGNSLPVHKY